MDIIGRTFKALESYGNKAQLDGFVRLEDSSTSSLMIVIRVTHQSRQLWFHLPADKIDSLKELEMNTTS